MHLVGAMDSESHIEKGKKELVKEVHRLARLGIRLSDFNGGSNLVQNGSKSSFIKDEKAKKTYIQHWWN